MISRVKAKNGHASRLGTTQQALTGQNGMGVGAGLLTQLGEPTPSPEPGGDQAGAFRFIIDFIYARSGIRLHQGKESLIMARLGKRMRRLGFQTLTQYCKYLKTSGDDKELAGVVDSLTTNFTHFLREEDHFRFMVGEALPALLGQNKRRFHIWSAASSSGEEPFSIAFYLAEHYPLAQGWDWQITASDLSTKVLDQARSAVYLEERVQTLPPPWVHKYFQKGVGRWTGYFRVKSILAERVAFQQINLLEDYSHPHAFEVIYCRNVMIYFDRATQERLVNRLCRFLVPGGFLFTGHSESLNGMTFPLRCLKPSIYQLMRS
jgi:chemotaxis protein methyltransferase CheR